MMRRRRSTTRRRPTTREPAADPLRLAWGQAALAALPAIMAQEFAGAGKTPLDPADREQLVREAFDVADAFLVEGQRRLRAAEAAP